MYHTIPYQLLTLGVFFRRFTELLGFNDTSVYDLLIDLYTSQNDYQKIYQVGCQLLQIDEVKFSEHNDRVCLLHKVVTNLAFAGTYTFFRTRLESS